MADSPRASVMLEEVNRSGPPQRQRDGGREEVGGQQKVGRCSTGVEEKTERLRGGGLNVLLATATRP